MKPRLGVVLVLAGLSAARANPQVPAGGEFRVNGYTTGSQYWPVTASTAAGDLVVVWSSYGQAGPRGVIFGRRYTAAGQPLGAELQLSAVTAFDQDWPAVAMGDRGDFVVAWTSYGGQDGDSTAVFARRFDASGVPRGAEFRVNTYTTAGQGVPGVAMDAFGNFVVVWHGSGQDGDSLGVFGQRYDSSGAPRGAEFQINGFTTSSQVGPRVASDLGGNFVVVWASYGQDASGHGVFGQRFNAAGTTQGAEFQANTYTTDFQGIPAVASDGAGNFVVAWTSKGQDGAGYGAFARRYDASGVPQGPELLVNTHTTGQQVTGAVALDGAGRFVVTWGGLGQGDDLYGVFAQRFDAQGGRLGSQFHVNTYTTGYQGVSAVASDTVGNFVVAWNSIGQDGGAHGVYAQRFGGLLPSGLVVDRASSPTSDGNLVLEPGESVDLRPSWRNANGAAQSFFGNAASFSGPSANGVSYELPDATGGYGTVASGTAAQCIDCYQVGVGFGGTRPALHWDATLSERLTPDAMGQTKPWLVHLGESFSDVPRSSPYYRFVETLLHQSVTGGCAADQYCPASTVTREQLSVFVLVGKEGRTYAPPACIAPFFGDVPASSPFCRWIEELARRGVVSGCGGGNYCPSSTVTREQMPVFVLVTLDPTLNPPACGTPMFGDVPANSPFCRWIEELARRGVVSGCGGGNYCPADPVTREQMAVFIAVTFGLALYGP